MGRKLRSGQCYVVGPTIFDERIDLTGTMCRIIEIDTSSDPIGVDRGGWEYLVQMPGGVDKEEFFDRAWFPQTSLHNIAIQWDDKPANLCEEMLDFGIAREWIIRNPGQALNLALANIKIEPLHPTETSK